MCAPDRALCTFVALSALKLARLETEIRKAGEVRGNGEKEDMPGC